MKPRKEFTVNIELKGMEEYKVKLHEVIVCCEKLINSVNILNVHELEIILGNSKAIISNSKNHRFKRWLRNCWH